MTATSLNATFTDAAGSYAMLTDYSGTINWGDGHTTAFSSSAVSGSNGSYAVSGSHQYAEEGNYNIVVTVNDDGGSSTTIDGTATVQDAPLSATGNFSFAATEGVLSTSQPVATFTDTDPNGATGDYVATINWGDNSTSLGTISAKGVGGVFTVSGTHTYAEEGNYAIGVSIVETDSDAGVVSGMTPVTPASTSANSAATVADSSLTATGVAVSAVEGAAVTGVQVAHFSDAYAADTSPSAYTATINWGDGGATASYTIVADANGGFDVFASKASPYAEQGNYGIAVTVTKTDADAHNLTGVTPVTASTVTADTTATVADAGLSVTKRDISATTGMSFSSVQVATLTDAAGSYSNPADLSVTINWGDETAPDSNVNLVEVGSTGVYKVEGSHMYAAAGQYPVTVSVSDRGGSKADDSAAPATATVTNAVWVDDNWTDVTNPAASTPAFGDVVAAPTGEIAPGATTLIYGVDAFNTIQGGVNADASGGTVYVLPGTYAENVVVPKSLSILGPNATIDPNNPLTPRNTEAIVVPAVADIETGDGGTGDTNGTIFRLGDPNNPTNPITVTIEGLTIDGNNAALPTSEGRLLNGVYVDTGAGIINSTGSYDQNPGGTKTTMIIENNIIENLDRYGVLGDTVGGTPQSGAIVSDNLITNIPSGNNYGGDRGRGVAFETNYYGTVSNNTITDVNVGYQNDNFYLPDPSGLGLQITNNTISTYHRGIFYNLVYDAASTGTISGNNISVDNTGLGADAEQFRPGNHLGGKRRRRERVEQQRYRIRIRRAHHRRQHDGGDHGYRRDADRQQVWRVRDRQRSAVPVRRKYAQRGLERDHDQEPDQRGHFR